MTVEGTGCVYTVAFTVKRDTLVGAYTPAQRCANSGTVMLRLVPSGFNASGNYHGALDGGIDEPYAHGTIALSLVESGSSISGQYSTGGKVHFWSRYVQRFVLRLGLDDYPGCQRSVRAFFYDRRRLRKRIFGYYVSASGCQEAGIMQVRLTP